MEEVTMMKNNEVVIEKVRKHTIVYIADFIFHGFGLLLFVTIAVFLSIRGGIAESYVSLLSGVLLLFTWLSFFVAWTKVYFDVWYITEKHIIAVNQRELLNREEAYMELSRIQDIFFEKEGILEAWLGYGKLRVQSAGTEQEFVLSHVRDVERIAQMIMALRDKSKGA